MASPFTWTTNKPADTDQVSVFPAKYRADTATLLAVLGTLIPTGTPTTGFRLYQNTDEIVLTTNIATLNTSTLAITQDNVALPSWAAFYSAANNNVVWYHAAAGATSLTAAMTLTASSLGLGSTPSVGGVMRLPNASAIEARNAANSADLQIAQYTSGNILQVGDTGSSGTAVYSGANGVQVDAPIKNIGATATMGVTAKVGSGAGNYTTTSSVYADVDATNLAYTVTVPAGWKMYIQANGTWSTGTNTTTAVVAIADGTTTLKETENDFSTSGLNATWAVSHVFVGDGASHTFKLRWKASNSQTMTMVNSSATLLPEMNLLLLPSN